MTHGAQAFITPLTFQALSGNPVYTELLDPEAEAGMGHIELARWADLVLVAPASCDTLAKFAAGLADDLLSTLYLATKAPVWVAPAMNQQMWAAKATQRNLATLVEDGVHVVMPEAGAQACGDVGLGRMPEPVRLKTIFIKPSVPLLKNLVFWPANMWSLQQVRPAKRLTRYAIFLTIVPERWVLLWPRPAMQQELELP